MGTDIRDCDQDLIRGCLADDDEWTGVNRFIRLVRDIEPHHHGITVLQHEVLTQNFDCVTCAAVFRAE